VLWIGFVCSLVTTVSFRNQSVIAAVVEQEIEGVKGRKLLWTFYLRRQSRDSLLRFLLLLKIKIKTKQPGALNWIEEERERDFVLLFIWYDRESKERDKHRRNSKRNGRSSRILLITTTATLLLLLYSVYFTRQKRKILVGHAFLLRGTQILQRGVFFFFLFNDCESKKLKWGYMLCSCFNSLSFLCPWL